MLQAFIEARKGGETGITHVEFLAREALFRAARQGRWSLDLARAAMRIEFGDKLPDITQPINKVEPWGMLLTYRDGTRGTVLRLGATGTTRWHFACKLAGEPTPRVSSHYVGPWGNRCLFMGLSHAIQHFFATRTAPYPVEAHPFDHWHRRGRRSLPAENRRLETPQLHIAYASQDFRHARTGGIVEGTDGGRQGNARLRGTASSKVSS